MSKAKRPRKLPPDERPSKAGDTGKAGTPQDVSSTRAKSSGHKKVTADKWNQ